MMRLKRLVCGAGVIALLMAGSVGFGQATLKGPALASDRADANTSAAQNGSSSPAVQAPEEERSFLHLLTLGGWAMWPLAACSLVGVALVIERALALRRGNIIPAGFMSGLEKVYRGRGDTAAAVDYCRSKPSAIGRIMSAGIRKLPAGDAAAEQAIADQGGTEVARLRRNLRLLHGIAAITPTIGLLGTVWGMIRAFEAARRVGLGHPEALLQGIYEALVATMCGLMIAVPVLIFYYVFLGIIDRTVLELNDTCQGFLERHEKGVEGPAGTSSHIPEQQPAVTL